MIYFNSRKQTVTDSSPDLLALPELPQDDVNPVHISKRLKEGSTIWGWYKVTDFKIKNGSRQLNGSALENLSYRFDGLTALKRSGNYLIYYRVEIGSSLGIYVKPSMIYMFKNSSTAELFSAELMNAYKLFFDEKSEFFSSCGSFIHKFSDEDLDSYLSWHRSLTITDKDLIPWQKRSQRFINPEALT